ncbi:MAG TPA: hypothetical protein VHC19_01680 [Pirellulales bacterium]|nr:hypothetical protein [Pirellulales bacterium]
MPPNRAQERLTLFEKCDGYVAFERVLAEAMERHRTRLLSHLVMPNRWYMVIWAREDAEKT